MKIINLPDSDENDNEMVVDIIKPDSESSNSDNDGRFISYKGLAKMAPFVEEFEVFNISKG
jgi:hypothetical protein